MFLARVLFCAVPNRDRNVTFVWQHFCFSVTLLNDEAEWWRCSREHSLSTWGLCHAITCWGGHASKGEAAPIRPYSHQASCSVLNIPLHSSARALWPSMKSLSCHTLNPWSFLQNVACVRLQLSWLCLPVDLFCPLFSAIVKWCQRGSVFLFYTSWRRSL